MSFLELEPVTIFGIESVLAYTSSPVVLYPVGFCNIALVSKTFNKLETLNSLCLIFVLISMISHDDIFMIKLWVG